MANHREYMQAMGIDVWRLRHTEAGVVEDVVAPAPAADETVDDGVVKNGNGSGIDINSLDLPALEQQVAGCKKCFLHQSRTQTVFGVGNPNADWMFVGEAPGAEEDRQGIPFVGRAGQLLTSMLFALGLERDAVYIANVLKCRPPGNRDPDGEEVMHCEPYLYRQVELVNPKNYHCHGSFWCTVIAKDA